MFVLTTAGRVWTMQTSTWPRMPEPGACPEDVLVLLMPLLCPICHAVCCPPFWAGTDELVAASCTRGAAALAWTPELLSGPAAACRRLLAGLEPSL